MIINPLVNSGKRRKRMCKDILDQLGEASQKKFQELVDEVGIETDELACVSIDHDKTSKLKRGEI